MIAQINGARGAIGYWLAVVALAVGLAWVIILVVDLRQRAETASESSDVRQEAVEILAEDVRTLRNQIQASGDRPAAPDPEERVEDIPEADEVEPPVVIEGPPGEPGADAPPPTAAQIRAAVSVVLAENPELPEDQVVAATTTYLQQNPPADGEDGRAPTDDEIAVAVAAYCGGGACQGPAGPEGPAGPTGPPGPSPTDEQIAAAVAAYCDDRGQCRGAPGEDGTDGQDGRSIISITCNDDNNWVFEFDRPPPTEIVEGPCRIESEPTPTPTGTPTSDPTGNPTDEPTGEPTGEPTNTP